MRLTIRYFGLACLTLTSCAILLSLNGFIKKSSSSYVKTGFNYSYDKKYSRFQTSPDYTAGGQICKVVLTDSEFRADARIKTGNPLIDEYGMNDVSRSGENGRGVIFSAKERGRTKTILAKYNLNTLASDLIPLNRKVPDSRLPR